MPSTLSRSIDFFREFGLFDIILPFLLVFTLVFAILEKTKIFGTEEDGKTPRKNLNAMVGFVIGLLVVATARVVSVINKALPNIILVLVISISFLILLGSFVKSGELDFSEKHKYLYIFVLVLLFLSVIFIFLAAIELESGETVLGYLINFVLTQWSGAVFGSVVILIVVILAIFFIVGGGKKPGEGGE